MRENHSHLLGLREESIALCSNLLLLALLFVQPYSTGGWLESSGSSGIILSIASALPVGLGHEHF